MLPLLLTPLAMATPTIHIDRAGRTLYLLNESGEILQSEAIGIGRGGLTQKVSMSDFVTPLGDFTVDLILRLGHYAVAPEAVEHFADDPEFAALLADTHGLATLMGNMNGIDFDGDGQPDVAYGTTYIGLSAEDGRTGPKMRRYRNTTPYWYSIALHHTPDPANFGAANSGGCLHLTASLLQQLVEENIVEIGRSVVIADGPPATPETAP